MTPHLKTNSLWVVYVVVQVFTLYNTTENTYLLSNFHLQFTITWYCFHLIKAFLEISMSRLISKFQFHCTFSSYTWIFSKGVLLTFIISSAILILLTVDWFMFLCFFFQTIPFILQYWMMRSTKTCKTNLLRKKHCNIYIPEVGMFCWLLCLCSCF